MRKLVAVMLFSCLPVMSFAAGGGNNRVFRVLTGIHRYALKNYPNADDDHRNRLDVEFMTLRFLKEHGVNEVLSTQQPVNCGKNSGSFRFGCTGQPKNNGEGWPIQKETFFYLLKRLAAITNKN